MRVYSTSFWLTYLYGCISSLKIFSTTIKLADKLVAWLVRISKDDSTTITWHGFFSTLSKSWSREFYGMLKNFKTVISAIKSPFSDSQPPLPPHFFFMYAQILATKTCILIIYRSIKVLIYPFIYIYFNCWWPLFLGGRGYSQLWVIHLWIFT